MLADAWVVDLHRKEYLERVVWQFFVGAPGVQADIDAGASTCRELHNVVKNPKKDLSQAVGVAHDPVWQIWCDLGAQYQTFFLGTRRNGGHCASYCMPDRKLDMVYFDPLGFDFGEVLEIVEQRQQRLGGSLGKLYVFELLLRQLGHKGELQGS